MRRRTELLANFPLYVKQRREVGANGFYSFEHAMFLIRSALGRNCQMKAVLSPDITMLDLSDVIIHGDAYKVLRKRDDESVDVVITSPPYWPSRRDFGSPLGFEPTLREYIRNLVKIFREVRRVLSRFGTLWIVMDDSHSHSTPADGTKKYHGRTSDAKMSSQQPFQQPIPDLPAGNIVFVAVQLAMALQKDGWICGMRSSGTKGTRAAKNGWGAAPGGTGNIFLCFHARLTAILTMPTRSESLKKLAMLWRGGAGNPMPTPNRGFCDAIRIGLSASHIPSGDFAMRFGTCRRTTSG